MGDMEELTLTETCDVCGTEVDAAEAVRAELTVGEMMCPTAMIFHPACHERASHMWQPDPDSYCTTDDKYPETQQWSRAGPPS